MQKRSVYVKPLTRPVRSTPTYSIYSMFNPRSRNHRQVLCELGGGSLLSLQQQSLTPQDFVSRRFTSLVGESPRMCGSRPVTPIKHSVLQTSPDGSRNTAGPTEITACCVQAQSQHRLLRLHLHKGVHVILLSRLTHRFASSVPPFVPEQGGRVSRSFVAKGNKFNCETSLSSERDLGV